MTLVARTTEPPLPTPIAPNYDLRTIPLEKIRHSTNNPRTRIDPVKQHELEESVRAKGIQTPIGVRPIHDGLYEVVHGERRVRAAEAVGVTTIPAIVTPMTDEEAYEAAAVENLQRHDMNVMDEAAVYAKLAKTHKERPEVAIARRTGQPESRVFRLLRYMTLEDVFKNALREDRLTMGHADELVRLTPKQRKDALERGLVWQESPLLRDGKHVPTKDDLAPLHELKSYIRDRTVFDPNAEDLKHFQPALAEEREDSIQEWVENAPENQHSDPIDPPTLLKLSEDSLVRMKTGLDDKSLPLSPSKWKEVKPYSCEFAELGAIVHGGPARVLTVCTKRSCKKHWPVAKRKPSATRRSSPAADEPQRAQWDQYDDERPIWVKFLAESVHPYLREESNGLKFGAKLVAFVLERQVVDAIAKEFDLKLTDATAAQFLWLSAVRHQLDFWSRSRLVNNLKPAGINAKPFEKQWQERLAAAKKAFADKEKARIAGERAKAKAAKKGKA